MKTKDDGSSAICDGDVFVTCVSPEGAVGQEMGVLLSDTSAGLPPGGVCVAGFISPSEEAALVGHLDGGEWSLELKRRVQHFGYRYDYRARAITADACLGALPGWL